MTITEVFPTNATITAKTTDNNTNVATAAVGANNSSNNNVLHFLGLQEQQRDDGNKNASIATNETAMAATLQPTIRGGMTAEVGQNL